MLASVSANKERTIKCVVWDLDDTLWDGVLLEGDALKLRDHARALIEALDQRGILQSVASRNDHALACAKLREFELEEYFLYPQIGWGAKSDAVSAIARELNLSVDSFAFIDDSAFERAEVAFKHPGVLCLDALELRSLADRAELNPRMLSNDGRARRTLYRSELLRRQEHESFAGGDDAFLQSLDLRMKIAEASYADLERAEELTVRTNQLNTTGYTYSFAELDGFRRSSEHLLLTAELADRFGSYGKIGLGLIACEQRRWVIKLLLMSCRVMSRGVGNVMLNCIRQRAQGAGVRLEAEFRETSVNRLMFVTYRFAGFEEIERAGSDVLLRDRRAGGFAYPDYVRVEEPDGWSTTR